MAKSIGFLETLMKIFKQITKIFSREKQNMLTEAVGPIPFHLTTRRSPTTNSFDIRQRNLESWITKLPIAHIGQTARLLFTAIRDMNELDIPSMDRFKAMEQLFPILVRVDGDISKRHTESFPLSGKASVVANLLKEFKEAISTSYKIIIVDILHNDKTIDTTILVTAIHHSLWYLGQVLLDSYKIYNIPPAMLWREMHWFYKFCEQNNLHQKVVITHNLPDDYIYLIPDTVEGVYKQVLLMSITNPYSLHHTETSKLYRKIGEWQKYCTLWRTNKEADYFTESFNADGEGLFIIELESDNQPITCSEKIYLDFSEKDCALIDTQNLHSIIDTYNIENKNTRISLKTIHDNLADNTIRRLIVGCVKASDRAFLRRKTSDNDGIEMILGFSAVHAALG